MAYEIDILTEINEDYGFPAKLLRYQLKDAEGDPVLINISSPGGDAIRGLEMVDELNRYNGKVQTLGFGLVASAATLLLVQGSPAEMTPNSFFMIHNSIADAQGRKEDLMNVAGVMDDIDGKMANIYTERLRKAGKISGNIELKVKRMMDAETWLTAQEALEMGFIDGIREASKQANIIQMQPALARYVNVPAALFNNQKPETMTAKEMLAKALAMLGGADEPETVEAVADTQPDKAPEMTAEQAMEFLSKSGYKVMTAEEVEALTAKSAEVEETNVRMAETMQAVITELNAVKAQVKQQMAAPSGASNRADDKPQGKPAASKFTGWAEMFKNKLAR